MLDCQIQPAVDIVHIACDGSRTEAKAWGGRVKTEEVDGHPYVISTTTFRANSEVLSPKIGEIIEYEGDCYQIKSFQFTKSVCRVIIRACRAVLDGCPLFDACLVEEVNQYGCDAKECPNEIAKFKVVLELSRGSQQVEDSRVKWDESYRIYLDPAWARLLDYQSWLLIGTDYYRVDTILDMDRLCRLPFAEVTRECPPWG